MDNALSLITWFGMCWRMVIQCWPLHAQLYWFHTTKVSHCLWVSNLHYEHYERISQQHVNVDGISMLFLDDVDVAVCWWVFFVNMCHRWRFQISDQSDIREHTWYTMQWFHTLMFIQSCVFLWGNGACISWGESLNDSHVDFLANVEQIQTTARACAAVLEDGKARGRLGGTEKTHGCTACHTENMGLFWRIKGSKWYGIIFILNYIAYSLFSWYVCINIIKMLSNWNRHDDSLKEQKPSKPNKVSNCYVVSQTKRFHRFPFQVVFI